MGREVCFHQPNSLDSKIRNQAPASRVGSAAAPSPFSSIWWRTRQLSAGKNFKRLARPFGCETSEFVAQRCIAAWLIDGFTGKQKVSENGAVCGRSPAFPVLLGLGLVRRQQSKECPVIDLVFGHEVPVVIAGMLLVFR